MLRAIRATPGERPRRGAGEKAAEGYSFKLPARRFRPHM